MSTIRLKFFYKNDITVISSKIEENEYDHLISVLANKLQTKDKLSLETNGGEGDKVLINFKNIEAILLIFNNVPIVSDEHKKIHIMTESGRKIIFHVKDDYDIEEEFLTDSDVMIVYDYMDNPLILNKSKVNTIFTFKRE